MPLMPGTKILDNETKRLIFTDLLINICWLLVFSLSGEIKADQVWTFFLSCVSVGSLQEQPVRWRTQLGDEQQQQQQADRCSFEAPLEGSAFRTHVGGLTEFWQHPVSVQAAIKHARVAKPWVSLHMSVFSFTLRF